MDRGHGSPYDRGQADAYYRRKPYPHKYIGDFSEEITALTSDEIREYMDGYNTQYDSGDFKDYLS